MLAVTNNTNVFWLISIAGFIAVFIAISAHFALAGPKFREVFGADRSLRWLDWLRLLIFPLTLLFVAQKLSPAGILRKLVFLLALFCFVILVVTGFVPHIFLGRTIWGWWLMIHVTAAGVFSACMAALAVLSAQEYRLDKNYLPWLNTILRRRPKIAAPPERYELVRKICFWMILTLCLPVILSVLLGMFPLFNTHGQNLLTQIHRYCTLALALLAIIYLYVTILTEMRRQAAG